MSLGRPVVATRVGGLTELVGDAETGLLVPDGDLDAFASALRALADDPALQQRLGDAGKERHAALFSADRMADDYAGALRAVIERRAATH
jgi:glycosyltransferase involved in cell wall biosynthesis